MTVGNMPEAEHPIDAQLARALLREQHPDLAALPLRQLAHGWDNVIYRLGADWTLRLPRRQLGADLVEAEQRWLPQLAPRLPLAVPVPLRSGGPGCGYPWRWSLCRWIEGDTAAVQPPSDPARAADVLGAFLRALHTPAPEGAPANPFRGVPLAARAEVTAGHFERLTGVLDTARFRPIWDEALAAPAYRGPPRWVHGDLHPANLLVRDGELCAVLDFGDLTAGDPATDLAAAWMLLDAPARQRLRAAGAAHVDDAMWTRARGWALAHALACIANSADQPVIAAMSRRTLARIEAEAACR